MTWRRIPRYAAAHARLRARLGLMPDADSWRYISGGTDVDAVVQRMRDAGLGRWVQDLPRGPDIETIEQTLTEGLADLAQDIARWLPLPWQGVKHWLQDGLALTFIRRLLRTHAVKLPARTDPLLLEVAQAPLGRRLHILAATRYGRYLQDSEVAFDRWLAHFDAVRPPSHGREAYIVSRVQRMIAAHIDLIKNERGRWRKVTDPTSLNPDAQWRMREEFAAGARTLLSGESFHAGAILVYGVLELLQFERVRALLTARRYQWEHVRLA